MGSGAHANMPRIFAYNPIQTTAFRWCLFACLVRLIHMSSLSCRRAAGRGLRLLLIVQMLCTGYGVLSLTNHQLNPV